MKNLFRPTLKIDLKFKIIMSIPYIFINLVDFSMVEISIYILP